MKLSHKISALVLFIIISFSIGAQNPPEKIKWIIPPKYDQIGDFKNDLAVVTREDRCGYIDRDGKEVIPLLYDDCSFFVEEHTSVRKNGKYGFIDKKGRVVIPFQYELAFPFTEGKAAVRLNDKMGFINTRGEVVIPLVYNFTDMFMNGFVKVTLKGKSDLIDHSNKPIARFKYDDMGNFQDGLARVSLNDKWGFINKKGEEVISLKYDAAGNFFEGFARVALAATDKKYDEYGYEIENDKWGFIDHNGNIIIPIKYFMVSDFSEGLAAFDEYGESNHEERNVGYFDKKGNIVFNTKKYYDVGEFHDGISIVSVDLEAAGYPRSYGGYGYMNRKFELVALPRFDNIMDYEYGYAAASIPVEVAIEPRIIKFIAGSKYGILNKKGETVIPFEFEDAQILGKDRAALEFHGKYGMVALE